MLRLTFTPLPSSQVWLKLLLRVGLGLILSLSTSCVHQSQTTQNETASLQYPPSDANRPAESYVSSHPSNMIVTAHPLATAAGINMLSMGGNAVDAAVASSFVLAVVRPQSTGIGGGGFALVYNPVSQSTKAYDFRERAPKAAHRDLYLDKSGKVSSFQYGTASIQNPSLNGHLAAGVPGLVDGLLNLHQSYGKLSRQTVMEPAIRLAQEGFPIYRHLAQAIQRRQKMLSIFPASKAIFFKGDQPLEEGEILYQKDLSKTLQRIAKHGAREFYEGQTAAWIAAEMSRSDGIITLEDLKSYRTLERKAVSGNYRGYEVVSMPPPSSGGVHIIQMLNLLESLDYQAKSIDDPQRYHYLIEAMRLAYADRAEYLGDPDYANVPVKGLTSSAYAKELAKQIPAQKAADSETVKHGNPLPYESASTTHLSVIDSDGMIVSSTHTVNTSLGAAVVVPGTGIILNNEMDDFAIKPGLPNAFGLIGSEANQVEAGKTMLSSMSPTLLFKDGKPKLVLGSPGGSRIITAVLQTILNYVDFQLPLDQAVGRLRIHHQWKPDMVFLEGDPEQLPYGRGLTEKGHKLRSTPFYLGDVQAIAIEKEGLVGASDPRGDGIPSGTPQ